MGPAKKTIERRKKFEIGYINDEFTEKAKIYAHTNEKLGQLTEKIGKVDSVLTVGSSGDQLLNLMANDVYNIDTFDINTFTNHYINLRLAAIKDIKDLQDLWYFLFNIHKKGFDECKDSLDPEAYQFWNHLFERFHHIEDLRVKIFRGDIDELDIMDNNYYLNVNILREMKKNLKYLNRNNFNTHLFNLHSFIGDKKYDAIILSNIYDYVDTVQFLRYLRTLREHLTKNGAIYYSYQYESMTFKDVVSLLKRKDYKDEYPVDRYYEEFGDIVSDTEIMNLDYVNNATKQDSRDAMLVLHK